MSLSIENKFLNDEECADNKKISNWVKENKKKIFFAGISISLMFITVYGIKNKEQIKHITKEIIEKIKNLKFYNDIWFSTASDVELELEREKVRLAFCSEGQNSEHAEYLYNILRRFDNEMSRRTWKNEIPVASSIHREHGWYLPNDN